MPSIRPNPNNLTNPLSKMVNTNALPKVFFIVDGPPGKDLKTTGCASLLRGSPVALSGHHYIGVLLRVAENTVRKVQISFPRTVASCCPRISLSWMDPNSPRLVICGEIRNARSWALRSLRDLSRVENAEGKWHAGIDLLSEPGYCIGQLPLLGRMSETSSQHLTEFLVRWRGGDQKALEQLIPLVYRELRDIARYHLRRD